MSENNLDPQQIWLQPSCSTACGCEREWCEDDAGPCDECGLPCVRYVKADVAADLERQLAEAREDELAQRQISDLWQRRAEAAERRLAGRG